MTTDTTAVARVLTSLDDITPEAWDACANPPGRPHQPFLSHAFLSALEESRCVHPRTGWMPQHIVVTPGDATCSPTESDADGPALAVMPLYLKSHSRGEFVFDYAWADAFERAGGRYYPKLVSAVPFTPVTGRRFLTPQDGDACGSDARNLALSAALSLAERHDVSSLHANFVTQAEWEAFGELGLLQRTDQQFHWCNDGYASFEDFLSSLASRKRKTVRKERRDALAAGLEVDWLTGSDLTEDHWDAFYHFYLDTGDRKWGSPYLNREFFSLLSERMADHVLLVMARREQRYVAGALNIIGGDTLYGRYWGCNEHHPCLHFELCYYQAIDFAIEKGLRVVEAGAQGEHKLARGYVPTTTYSLHWIANPSLRSAIANYLDHERDYVAQANDELASLTPFKKGG